MDAEGTADEPITWRDPWPTTAVGGTRYGPADDEHPGADRDWRLVLVPRDRLVEEVRAREAAGWPLVGTWASEAARVEAWRPRASHEVDHRTIPHELDWLRTAVHLTKGCYRGQETVARVHNLGRPPRRLVMLHLDGSGHLLPEPGAAVHDVVRSADVAGARTGGRTGHHRRAPPRARARSRWPSSSGPCRRTPSWSSSPRPGPSRPARSRSCPATVSPWTVPPPADP